ncbi:MAG: methionyl-tRNA formyltransferase [Desulfotomaculaceae bacterium]|nr:methionyl-tRNA formyltransferase [Desulfotomaculaceae bacterium]
MRLIFMGTPDFAVPSLKALVESKHTVLAVVTQPDRPKGRGKKETPPPVKDLAQSLNLLVIQPSQVREPDFVSLLRSFLPEVIVVVAYGKILPRDVLLLPKYGCINLHASLLPKYRGAAPIHRALINGELETGITTMFMDEGLDTGDIILQKSIPILEEDTVGTVHDRLAVEGARLLNKTLYLIEIGQAPRKPQKGKSSYAPVITGADELIQWNKPARDIFNHIRGMNPWPGAHTFWGNKMLKIWRTHVREEDHTQEHQRSKPGQILKTGREGIMVCTGRGIIVIDELQLQGAKRMSAADFLRGTPGLSGAVLANVQGWEAVSDEGGDD